MRYSNKSAPKEQGGYQPVPTSPPANDPTITADTPVATTVGANSRLSNASNSTNGSHLIDISADEIHELVTSSVHAVTSFWDSFKAFIARGSAVDLGVGMMLGTVFTALINSFMTDILTPPIGLLVGSALDETFLVLRQGQSANATYHTVKEALADGAVTVNFGRFMNQFLTFLLVSLILYWTIKAYEAMKKQIEEELQELRLAAGNVAAVKRVQITCPECDELISKKAKRCPHCTSLIEDNCRLGHIDDISADNSDSSDVSSLDSFPDLQSSPTKQLANSAGDKSIDRQRQIAINNVITDNGKFRYLRSDLNNGDASNSGEIGAKSSSTLGEALYSAFRAKDIFGAAKAIISNTLAAPASILPQSSAVEDKKHGSGHRRAHTIGNYLGANRRTKEDCDDNSGNGAEDDNEYYYHYESVDTAVNNDNQENGKDYYGDECSLSSTADNSLVDPQRQEELAIAHLLWELDRFQSVIDELAILSPGRNRSNASGIDSYNNNNNNNNNNGSTGSLLFGLINNPLRRLSPQPTQHQQKCGDVIEMVGKLKSHLLELLSISSSSSTKQNPPPKSIKPKSAKSVSFAPPPPPPPPPPLPPAPGLLKCGPAKTDSSFNQSNFPTTPNVTTELPRPNINTTATINDTTTQRPSLLQRVNSMPTSPHIRDAIRLKFSGSGVPQLKQTNMKRSPGGTPIRSRSPRPPDGAVSRQLFDGLKRRFKSMNSQHNKSHDSESSQDDDYDDFSPSSSPTRITASLKATQRNDESLVRTNNNNHLIRREINREGENCNQQKKIYEIVKKFSTVGDKLRNQ